MNSINNFGISTDSRLGMQDVRRRAFTLVELLVVLAVVAILLALQLPGLARVQTQSRQAQCAANLRQLALAEIIYGTEHADRLPSLSGGFWLWDTPTSVTSQLGTYGAQRRQFYCPANPDQNTDGLWNFSLQYRVAGYVLTMSGSSTLIATNANVNIYPPQQVVGAVVIPAPPAAQRVLAADVIISQVGQYTASQKLTYQYTGIQGGYSAPGFTGHRASHLDFTGRYPAGGNVAMLDGHVEWQNFANAICRTQPSGGTPGFWW
jgi:prepilin-type N-terminal cleavage/methylation domain-containing protein/prepilin-type processing-associated H-X9-DG protein